MTQAGHARHHADMRRSMSAAEAWAFALGCVIGWGAFVMPGTTFLPQAGPVGTAVSVAIAVAMMAVIALNFGFMMERMPVAGGPLAYTERAFGRIHAFVCAWFLVLSYGAIVPQNATALTVVLNTLFRDALRVGYLYTIAGYRVYAGEVVLSSAVIGVFALVAWRRPRVSSLLQVVFVGTLVACVGCLALLALGHPEALGQAFHPAFHPNVAPVAGTLAVLASMPWAFVGFDTVSLSADVHDFSPRRAFGVMLLAIVVGACIYVSLCVLGAMAPGAYGSWDAYVDAAPRLTGLEALSTFHAAFELFGPVGLTLVGAAALCANLTGVNGFFVATARVLDAMAHDDFLPDSLGTGTSDELIARRTTLFVLAFSVAAVFLGRMALSWVVDMSSLGAAIGFGYTSAAAHKVARREGNASRTALGLLGVAFSIAFVVLLLVPIPGIAGSLGRESYVCLIAWIALGLNYFTPKSSSE